MSSLHVARLPSSMAGWTLAPFEVVHPDRPSGSWESTELSTFWPHAFWRHPSAAGYPVHAAQVPRRKQVNLGPDLSSGRWTVELAARPGSQVTQQTRRRSHP